MLLILSFIVCEENFEKNCQITFKQQATRETVKKCYKPQRKVCDGQGPEECKTVYESSCTTRYVEKRPGIVNCRFIILRAQFPIICNTQL